MSTKYLLLVPTDSSVLTSSRSLSGLAMTFVLVYYNSFNSWGWLDSLPREVIDAVEVVAGDIRDSSGVDAAVNGCQKVLHLAALIAIPFSYNSPDAYVQTNVTGTLNVLQSARRHEVEHLICTSTSDAFMALTIPSDR